VLNKPLQQEDLAPAVVAEVRQGGGDGDGASGAFRTSAPRHPPDWIRNRGLLSSASGGGGLIFNRPVLLRLWRSAASEGGAT
jgi:hypothetical protein